MTDTILSEIARQPHDGETVRHESTDGGIASTINLEVTVDDLLAVFTGGVLVLPVRGVDSVRLRLPGRHEVEVL